MEQDMRLNKNITSPPLLHIFIHCNEHIPLEAETQGSLDRNEYQTMQVHCHRSVMIQFQ